MKCVRVEELDESYRCFFLSEVDGITINNEFTVGTLALAQNLTLKKEHLTMYPTATTGVR